MISTSFIIGTGFMKCMPINFSGLDADANSVIEMDDVLLAKIDSCLIIVSSLFIFPI